MRIHIRIPSLMWSVCLLVAAAGLLVACQHGMSGNKAVLGRTSPWTDEHVWVAEWRAGQRAPGLAFLGVNLCGEQPPADGLPAAARPLPSALALSNAPWTPEEVAGVLHDLEGEDAVRDLALVGLSWNQDTSRALGRLRKLDELRIWGGGPAGELAAIDDTVFADLTHMQNLRVLKVSDSPLITGKGIAGLVRNTNLETLDLSETSTGDAALAEISQITSLRSLMLFDTHVSARGLRALVELPHLACIGLSDVDADGVAALNEHPATHTLFLRTKQFSQTQAASILELRKLAALRVYGAWSSAVVGACAEGLPALTDLEIHGEQLDATGDAVLDRVRAGQNIRRLSIKGMHHVSQEALSHLAQLEQLQSLALGGVIRSHYRDGKQALAFEWRCDGKMVKELARLRQLSELELTHMYITVDALRELQTLPHLRRLILRHVEMDPGALAGISSLDRLECVSTTVSLSETDVMHLASLRSLRLVDISGSVTKIEDIERLVHKLNRGVLVRYGNSHALAAQIGDSQRTSVHGCGNLRDKRW